MLGAIPDGAAATSAKNPAVSASPFHERLVTNSHGWDKSRKPRAAWLCGQYRYADPSMLRVHNMYSYPREPGRRYNVFFAVAIVWCVGIWVGLAYLIGTFL